MPDSVKNQDREIAKGHKLEYLYQIDADAAIYPLLGACIRALGKGWTVQVFASHAHLPVFAGLKALLKAPDTLWVSEYNDTTTASNRESKNSHLVLIDGVSDPHAIKPIRDMVLGKAHVMAAGADTFTDDYDLISRFTYENLHTQGVTGFTGGGKGKSTSAFGIATAATARGARSAIVQWFKEPKGPRGTWSINEHYFPDFLHDARMLEFYPTGIGFYSLGNLDRVKGPDAYAQHRNNAIQGVELAKRLIASGNYKVIVLDEFVDTLAEVSQNIPQSLVDITIVHELLSYATLYPETEIVVTGRRVTPHWSDFIKRSCVIDEIRHPWSNKGKAAISGLDF